MYFGRIMITGRTTQQVQLVIAFTSRSAVHGFLAFSAHTVLHTTFLTPTEDDVST